jgi:hypothetical protein
VNPLVVIVTEEGAGSTEHEFEASPVRIGRSDLNDLVLQQPFVGRFHARVEFNDTEACFFDLGSLNGSRLDGKRIKGSTPLGTTAEVQIPDADPGPGSLKLKFARKGIGQHAPPPVAVTVFAVRTARSQAKAPSPDFIAADPAAEHAAAEALRAAGLKLDLSVASYRGSWEHLRATIEGAIAGLQGSARELALRGLTAKYLELSAEPQFLAMLSPGAVASQADGNVPEQHPPRLRFPPFVAGSAPGEDALQHIRTFCDSYLVSGPEHLAATDVKGVLDRVAAVLETFAGSFLEMQRGYSDCQRDLGLRVLASGAFARAADTRQLLSYLLDPGGSGRERELKRAFGDLEMHEVALLKGVEKGAQALLAEVGPEAIAPRVGRRRLWLHAQALWEAFEERYQALAGDNGAISSLLYGREFARAYYAYTGQGNFERASREHPASASEPHDKNDKGNDDEEGDAP